MKQTEYDEQCALFQWAVLQINVYPELAYLYASANGGKRDAVTGAQLKAAGVKAGYPDIGLDVARGGYHGLRIELKTITGRLRANQREWLDWLTSQGYLAVACHGMEEAQDTIEDYLRGLLVRPD